MNTRLGSVLAGPLIWETASTIKGALFMVRLLDYGANGTQRNGRSRAKEAPNSGWGAAMLLALALQATRMERCKTPGGWSPCRPQVLTS